MLQTKLQSNLSFNYENIWRQCQLWSILAKSELHSNSQAVQTLYTMNEYDKSLVKMTYVGTICKLQRLQSSNGLLQIQTWCRRRPAPQLPPINSLRKANGRPQQPVRHKPVVITLRRLTSMRLKLPEFGSKPAYRTCSSITGGQAKRPPLQALHLRAQRTFLRSS